MPCGSLLRPLRLTAPDRSDSTVFWMRPQQPTITAWQTATDRAIEAGQTPLLNLGCVDAAVDGLPGLAALAEAQPWPLATEPPLAVAGGGSQLWLAALLRPNGPGLPERPTVAVLFGGADAATQMASLNMMDAAQRSPLTREPQQIPTGYWRDLAPHSQPLSAAPWEALPMVLADESQDPASQAATAKSPDEQPEVDGWVGWTALGLALLLVILALLL